IERFAQAEKRPSPDVFAVTDATLAGTMRKAISVNPAAGTRLTYKVRIPDDGWLWVSVGMKPETWELEGDGVKFLAGISDGRAFEPLFEQHVQPFANAGDRKWLDVRVDLSTYAGEEVELIFNTYASLPGRPSDLRNDLGLWGSPEIVVR
ncbi:MAG: hypothetical protein ACRD15_19365, partial [Vicinamibacterales bacterium]